MTTLQKILFFFVLPMITPLLFPPNTLLAGPIAIVLVMLLFGVLGILLMRGREQALTLAIFLLGLNAIVRIMMFFAGSTFSDGSPNYVYIVTSLLSISLSIYLLLRLDRVDVRTQMVS